MFKAKLAVIESQRGAEEVEIRKTAAAEKKQQEWLHNQRASIPSWLADAEAAIKTACSYGRRRACTGIAFVQHEDYEGTFSRDHLCEPHQELLRHFEDAGYTVEFKYDFEPHSLDLSTESHEIVLSW